MGRNDQRERLVRAGHEHEHEGEERHRQDLDPDTVRDDPPPPEHEREGQEVDGQRHDPEERDRGDVRRQIGRDAQHQAGRDGRQQDPAGTARGGDRPVVGRSRVRVGGSLAPGRCRMAGRAGSPQHEGAAAGQHQERAVSPRPQSALRIQTEVALDEHRIGEEGQHASEVAGGVQDVRVACGPVTRRGKPRLQDRTGRADGEEGESHGHREQRQKPGNGAGVAGRDPARGQGDRQDHERQGEDEKVERRLPARPEPARGDVRIGIPAQQDRLVEHHRRVPDAGRSAEEGQRHPREHRLDEEQKARTDEDRDAEQN